jgi:hypothetical protein
VHAAGSSLGNGTYINSVELSGFPGGSFVIPEAFHNGPRFSGLLAAFGFGLLLLVDAAIR